jgi:hypothetical protein
MSNSLHLIVLSGESAGRRYSVAGKKSLKLGRSSSNDIQISDERLSRMHCLFECTDVGEVYVLDLASANGTFVNGEMLDSARKLLKEGDIIEVGETTIKLAGTQEPEAKAEPPGEEGPAPSPEKVRRDSPKGKVVVDLGLGEKKEDDDFQNQPSDGSAPVQKQNIGRILWLLLVLVLVCAASLVLLLPQEKKSSVVVAKELPDATAKNKLVSLFYEKIEATSSRIFRFSLNLDSTGNLHVVCDDLPGEDRHVDKSVMLSEKAKKRIYEIMRDEELYALDNEYAGSSVAFENSLKRWRMRIVRKGEVKEITVENTSCPEALKRVAGEIETFARNELGIWSLQYSKEKLLQLSRQSEEVGDAKWLDRDHGYANLAVAVKSYKEAIFYLETVRPKPKGFEELKGKFEKASAELDVRYKNQRFLADRALNLGNWEVARDELRTLCEMLPDKSDARHDEAYNKLIDVERRIEKMNRGGR